MTCSACNRRAASWQGNGALPDCWYFAGLQEAPGILQTIEDFMWFKLALVRPSRPESATTSGYFSSGESCLAHPCLSILG